MSHSTPSHFNNDMFDLKRIKRLVELMQEHELAELDIQQADMRIQLKRNTSVAALPIAAPAASPAPSTASSIAPATGSAEVAPPEEKNVQLITSPMVGTFYTAPNPDSPPFVKVGDTINAESTICLIEAMKVYNEIQAECSGNIVAILAKNGESVEFGKPLFKVKTDA